MSQKHQMPVPPMYKLVDGKVEVKYPHSERLAEQYAAEGYSHQHINQEFPKYLGYSLKDGSRVIVNSKEEEKDQKLGVTYTKDKPVPQAPAPLIHTADAAALQKEVEELRMQNAQLQAHASKNRKPVKEKAE